MDSDRRTELRASRWVSVVALLLIFVSIPAGAEDEPSPCQGSLDALAEAYATDEATRAADSHDAEHHEVTLRYLAGGIAEVTTLVRLLASA